MIAHLPCGSIIDLCNPRPALRLSIYLRKITLVSMNPKIISHSYFLDFAVLISQYMLARFAFRFLPNIMVRDIVTAKVRPLVRTLAASLLVSFSEEVVVKCQGTKPC